MSGGSDPVITKKPEGACTFAVYGAMNNSKTKAGRGVRPAFALASMTGGCRHCAILVARPVGFYRRGGPGIGVGVTESFAHGRWRAVRLSELVALSGSGDLHRRGG